jgi:aspartyl-tRNA(Asn)/glutamyl-tRNA(Gln) amidotransferase subunit A
MELAGILYATEAYATWRSEAMEAQPELRLSDDLAAVSWRAGPRRRRLRRRLDRRFGGCAPALPSATAGYDALLAPTIPVLPPAIADLADDAYYTRINLETLSHTRIGNLLALTALTLPTGVPMTGVMLMAPHGAEARLLRLGIAAEAALSG